MDGEAMILPMEAYLENNGRQSERVSGVDCDVFLGERRTRVVWASSARLLRLVSNCRLKRSHNARCLWNPLQTTHTLFHSLPLTRPRNGPNNTTT